MTDLAAILAAGRAAWPDVLLEDTAAKDAAAAAFPDGVPAVAYPADLYLAWACATGDPVALQHLEREHLANVGAFISRVDASPAAADEIRQLLRERLLVGARPRVLEYQARGPLGGWIRIAAVRLAIDRVRGRAEDRTQPLDDAELVAGASDPELVLLRERYRADFEVAMRAALAALTVRERRLLRMSAVDGMSIDQIATVYRVHRATAARWLVAIREQVAEATYREVGDKLLATRSELASLRAAIASQLELSLTALLTRP